MKENTFDVLMYLFENYMDDDMDMLPHSEVIKTELHEAGFEQLEVNKAFDWLESLTAQHDIKASATPTFRIFCPQEIIKLDIESRNLLIFLEYSGILSATNRELVIDRAMALEDEDITIEKLKWIVLMVLLCQPDEDLAFSRMEDIVYDLVPEYLH